MPFIGAIMAKMLFVLMDVHDLNDMREQSDQWCMLMGALAACALFTGFSQKFSFGVIGENVAFNIRQTLYRKILEKHQGWFDERDNSPGALSTTLASDAQLINGVSTEGVGSIMEALCAVATGITIAFIYSWRMSCVCLIIAPFAAITGYMGAKRRSGLGEEQDQSKS